MHENKNLETHMTSREPNFLYISRFQIRRLLPLQPLPNALLRTSRVAMSLISDFCADIMIDFKPRPSLIKSHGMTEILDSEIGSCEG